MDNYIYISFIEKPKEQKNDLSIKSKWNNNKKDVILEGWVHSESESSDSEGWQ